MREIFLVTLLFLIPALVIANEEFSWETFLLRTIRSGTDRTSVRSKLSELGATSDIAYENFRLREVFFCGAFTLPVMIFQVVNGSSYLTILGSALAIPAMTLVVIERSLNRKVIEHRIRIESDFPGIVEMMTLALSAGESPMTVLKRISDRGSGPLTREFEWAIDQVDKGTPFSQALDQMSRRTHSIAVRRFVDAIVIAITRGAPLIDVLHSHAKEARDSQRNQILSAAGKSEIAMMIPVVFLILPISILFALWPSLSSLNLFAAG
jgi:tight adherence protein C